MGLDLELVTYELKTKTKNKILNVSTCAFQRGQKFSLAAQTWRMINTLATLHIRPVALALCCCAAYKQKPDREQGSCVH